MPHFVKDEDVFEAVQSLRSDVDKLLKNAGLDEKPQEKQAPEGGEGEKTEGEAKAVSEQPPAEAKGSGSKAQQSGSSGSSPQSTKDAEKK